MYHKFGNMVILRSKPGLSENYSFLVFSSKKVEIDNVKVVFLLEIVVIINEFLYNQAYIFVIIEL